MILQNEYYITQRFVFLSLVPVLNKLPDHPNLPLFNDMLQFWYQSRVSLFVLLGFFVSIKTVSFDIKLNQYKMITQNQRTNQRAAARVSL